MEQGLKHGNCRPRLSTYVLYRQANGHSILVIKYSMMSSLMGKYKCCRNTEETAFNKTWQDKLNQRMQSIHMKKSNKIMRFGLENRFGILRFIDHL